MQKRAPSGFLVPQSMQYMLGLAFPGAWLRVEQTGVILTAGAHFGNHTARGSYSVVAQGATGEANGH